MSAAPSRRALLAAGAAAALAPPALAGDVAAGPAPSCAFYAVAAHRHGGALGIGATAADAWGAVEAFVLDAAIRDAAAAETLSVLRAAASCVRVEAASEADAWRALCGLAVTWKRRELLAWFRRVFPLVGDVDPFAEELDSEDRRRAELEELDAERRRERAAEAARRAEADAARPVSPRVAAMGAAIGIVTSMPGPDLVALVDELHARGWRTLAAVAS